MRNSKILENYIINKFFFFFIFSLMASVFIYVFIDFVGLFFKFQGKPLNLIIIYYLNYIPYISTLTIPTSVMLGSLFSFSSLNKTNELIAMKSSGISMFRIMLPVIRLSIMIAITVFMINEFVVPKTEKKRGEMYKNIFNNGRSKFFKNKYNNIWYLGINKTIYTIKTVKPKKEEIHNCNFFFYNSNNVLIKKLSFEKGKFSNKHTLNYQNATIIKFGSKNDAVFKQKKASIQIPETFDDFLIEQKPPESMNFMELKQYITKMERSGYKVNGLWADLYFKFALPILNIIIIFLSAPLVSRHTRGGNAKNIGVGLMIVFFYYISVKMGLALGHSHILPPFIAAWIGNVIYAILGIYIYQKSK